MTGDLDAWPRNASDTETDASNIMGHIYFPNNWAGPQDHSIRLRLAHDGTNLYVGIHVRDDVLTARDTLSVWTSAAGYLDWRGPETVRPDRQWVITLPHDRDATGGTGAGGFRYTARRTPDGTVVEGQAPLAGLGLAPGGSIGFLVTASDDDGQPNLSHHSWARKLTTMLPHRPNFTTWSDARNCGRLVLAP